MTYLLPCFGDLGVEHAVEGVSQVLRHDDRTVDGKPQVVQRGAHRRDDALHPETTTRHRQIITSGLKFGLN